MKLSCSWSALESKTERHYTLAWVPATLNVFILKTKTRLCHTQYGHVRSRPIQSPHSFESCTSLNCLVFFSRLYLHYCLSSVHNRDDHSHIRWKPFVTLRFSVQVIWIPSDRTCRWCNLRSIILVLCKYVVSEGVNNLGHCNLLREKKPRCLTRAPISRRTRVAKRRWWAEAKADVQGPGTYQPIGAYDVYLQEDRVQQQLFLCKCRSLMYRSLHLYGGGHV